jgi:hypothetical protein
MVIDDAVTIIVQTVAHLLRWFRTRGPNPFFAGNDRPAAARAGLPILARTTIVYRPIAVLILRSFADLFPWFHGSFARSPGAIVFTHPNPFSTRPHIRAAYLLLPHGTVETIVNDTVAIVIDAVALLFRWTRSRTTDPITILAGFESRSTTVGTVSLHRLSIVAFVDEPIAIVVNAIA